MKNTIKLLVFLTIFSNCKAQNRPILRTVTIAEQYSEDFNLKSGDYIKDTNNTLNKYVGTWQYNNGSGTILTIKIQKKSQLITVTPKSSYYYYDKIITTYKLVKNGVTLVDNLSLPIPNDFNNLSVENMKYGKFRCVENINHVTGTITDLTLGIITSAEIELLELSSLNSPPQIKFSMYGNDSRRLNPESFYEGKPTFEIPNFKTLTKID